ncbi:LacI family DNA-binding transcriptional regulator [Dysgonomonas sp. Marseille-P4677]|uniref:LacI family DNA-binding transcriptional regulator n=1 Tax=Dysgonomonas sp. Marseille-P4677 TaxID=2364790 RepID=UPI001911E002|nr:LacI family DNA-binding transcriptional regulator [Dysgonomonas sp. Marseille-P4677]MBK5722353.1 LacI family DNA-binding transcriptional regulator [Dysgonomonas sp. Marseille-P4677]
MEEKRRHISLKDLAAELGVSISTVSRALKNSPEISKEMCERVKTLAKKRNYRPNPFAMSLLKNSPRLIGIIVPDIVTHFYSSIISGISDVARKNSYSVIITSTYEQYELEKQSLEDLINIRVEGIIACLSQETTDYSHFDHLADQNIPLVFFDRVCLTEKFSSVITDNVESAQKATEHLLATGSKRIGFIGGSNHLEIVQQRKHGYLQALRDHKIPIEKELVFCKKIDYKQGYEGACTLLSQANPPDAILAMTDSIAFGAMRAIKEKGLRIPEDVALIGYTDEAHSNYVDPPLTAVTHQTYKMGEAACNLMLRRLKGTEKPKQIVVPALLSIRESSVKNRV